MVEHRLSFMTALEYLEEECGFHYDDDFEFNKEAIREAVVRDDWQEFRGSLKGLGTMDKIEELGDWYSKYGIGPQEMYTRWVQVKNYLNALKRGGLLV